MNGKDIAKGIREKNIGSQDKRALIVEGKDDVSALTILFNRYYSDWEQNWVIEEAGSKSNVQTALTEDPSWLGIVDRDEWGSDLIQQKADEQSNLIPLPRFCLENYLINPDELWPAIPATQQQKVQNGQQEFAEAILEGLSKYVRHGVLWKVVTPLWSGLRSLGFKDALAAYNSIDTAQDDDAIKKHLYDWNILLDPKKIFDDFENALTEANSLEIADQLKTCVHGKVFWQGSVNPAMNSFFGQMSEKNRKNALWKALPMPDDLSFLVDRMNQ